MSKMLNAHRVRVWLAERDLSQGQLAETAGLAEETLSRAMRGKQPATPGILLALHQRTGIPVADLVLDPPAEAAS